MKRLLMLALLIFVGMVGWRVGESLSSDATGMAIGILLGVMAGIPTSLLVLASDRRNSSEQGNHRSLGRQSDHRYATHHAGPQGAPYGGQPPVIVVTGGSQPQSVAGWQEQNQAYHRQNQWQPDFHKRTFTVVGDEEIVE